MVEGSFRLPVPLTAPVRPGCTYFKAARLGKLSLISAVPKEIDIKHILAIFTTIIKPSESAFQRYCPAKDIVMDADFVRILGVRRVLS
jgi:hypothetical protein